MGGLDRASHAPQAAVASRGALGEVGVLRGEDGPRAVVGSHVDARVFFGDFRIAAVRAPAWPAQSSLKGAVEAPFDT
jgi:hypothetical protein